MRLKPLHTIWLTLFSTLILLVSSVVNSAPLMSLEMMQSNTQMPAEMLGTEHCGSHNSMDMMMPMPSNSVVADMGCEDNSGMVHNCCTTACSFVFVSLPVPVEQPHPLANRASISLDTTDPVVQISHSLYRPPIA